MHFKYKFYFYVQIDISAYLKTILNGWTQETRYCNTHCNCTFLDISSDRG